MTTLELLLRTLLKGHPNLDLVCQVSRDAIEGHQRDRAGVVDAMQREHGGLVDALQREHGGLVDAMQRERDAVQREREAMQQAMSGLRLALDMAKVGNAGGVVPGGEKGVGLMVTQAEAEALAQKAVLDYKRVASYDPFPRILPHCPSTPSERSAASSSGRSPNSASPTSRGRKALKGEVAQFYGLACDDRNFLVDMLGQQGQFQHVELAHIWPASYQDFGPFARDMALPEDFFVNPRNYLLLPRDLHEAFDCAKVCFIPCQAGVRVRVLHREGLSDRVAALDGTLLHLPHSAATPPGVPYKRILGWMAWLAKGFRILTPESEKEMREALEASSSSVGNAALTSLVDAAA